ncbi:MAG: glycosyltransferase family 9 protein, partial [Candidatus Hydrogenedentota bacterium]
MLIIKIGFSEFLDNRVETTISLGDILRSTSILHLFRNDVVTLLTAKEGLILLEGNPYIKRLLTYDLTTILQLQAEH